MFNFSSKKKVDLFSPADGILIPLEKVSDPVFSKGMMGIGFAVEPTSGDIYAPLEGKIASIFPTKHAIGIAAKDGKEILLHLGIDTVELNGEGFEVFVEEGDKVVTNTKIAKMNLAYLEEKNKPNTIMLLIPSQTEPKMEIIEKRIHHGELVTTK